MPGAFPHRVSFHPALWQMSHTGESQFMQRALWDNIKYSPADLVAGTFPRAVGVGGLNPKAHQLPALFSFKQTQSHFSECCIK